MERDADKGDLAEVRNGILGGLAGGLLGGLLLLYLRGKLEGALGAGPDEVLWSPSAGGFIALGLCVGLAVGLAQVLLREAWLCIEAGPRTGRQFLLQKDELTIGRAEACDLGLFGDSTVEKQHARIVADPVGYLLVDAGSGATTHVNNALVREPIRLRSGDRIRIGSWTLQFHERRHRA